VQGNGQPVRPQAPKVGVLAVMTGLMFAVGPVTVDLSLPAMPVVQSAIGTPQWRVELTLTLLFFGLAVVQFVIGGIADRHGRRALILGGLAAYTAGAVLASVAPNMLVFAAGRLVQAAGFGVAVVLIRSAVADVCDPKQSAKAFSIAVMMVSLSSVVAPAVGGYLLKEWGWRSVFEMMAAYGIFMLVAVSIFLPETFPGTSRTKARFRDVLTTYVSLMRVRAFATLATLSAAAAAFQFTYNTGAPSVLIQHFGLSAQSAGVIFSLIALCMAAASQINALLLKWLEPRTITNAAVTASACAGAALLAATLTAQTSPLLFITSLFVLISTIGFIMGNALGGAMSAAGTMAGAGSALIGVLQFLFGTLGSAVVGLIPDPVGRPMGGVIVVLALLSLWLVWMSRPVIRGNQATAA
jgi:DHA1 family bicyclomycin/chloramphenicol resistance-like MFS transporter